MIKMTSQRFYPHGLKILKECISRATLLSQPADIPNFLSDYMSKLLLFRDSSHEIDPKLLSYDFQELYEKHFFGYLTERNETTEIKAEVKKALETLFSSLTSGNEENVEQKSAAPESEPSVSKVSLASVCPTDLKQTHHPRVKTDTPSSLRTPNHEKDAGATGHPRPTPTSTKTRPTEKIVPQPSRIMTGHVKPSTSKSVPAPKSGVSSKPPTCPKPPAPVLPKKRVLPPIPQKNRAVPLKSKTDLPKQRVVSKLTTCKEPEKTTATKPQPPTSKEREPRHEESVEATGKTAKIDFQPYPSSQHPRPTPPPAKARPTEKMVPPPSSVLTGHVKPVPPPFGISKKVVRWQDDEEIPRPTETHQPRSSTSTGVPAPQSRVSSKPPTSPNHAAPVLSQKPVLPPIPQETRAVPPVSKLTTCKDKEPENTRSQPPTSKDREPDNYRTESVTERVARQESIRTMPKTLKDRKPDRPRTQLSSIKEEEPESTRTLTASTLPPTTELAGLEKTKTQTQSQTKTEFVEKNTETTLAKVYKPLLPKTEKTRTQPTKPRPEWTFDHHKLSKTWSCRVLMKQETGLDVAEQHLWDNQDL
ncbi:hypothetical protein Q8A73_005201 [Channa argus]|nr:hypothetical protein Q8A73_005201 [Channa argus]